MYRSAPWKSVTVPSGEPAVADRADFSLTQMGKRFFCGLTSPPSLPELSADIFASIRPSLSLLRAAPFFPSRSVRASCCLRPLAPRLVLLRMARFVCPAPFIHRAPRLVLCALRSAPRALRPVPRAPCFVLRASCSVLSCAAFSALRACFVCASCSAPRALTVPLCASCSAPRGRALRLVLCAPRPLPRTPRSSCSAPRALMLYRCSVIRASLHRHCLVLRGVVDRASRSPIV